MFNCIHISDIRLLHFLQRSKESRAIHHLREENEILKCNQEYMLQDIDLFKKEVERLNNIVIELKKELKENK